MAGESISIPILTPGADAAARNIKQVGDAAAGTAAKLDFAALSLKAFNDAAAKSAKADQALTQARKADTQANKLLIDSYNVLTGRQTEFTRLQADASRKLDDTAKKAATAAGGFTALAGTGGLGGGGMGAVLAAAAALAAPITTITFGLAGFGLAAAGAVKPVLNAAQATGGLAKNLQNLNPEQRRVAQGLLGLGRQYSAFSKALAPQVLSDFNQGLTLAGHLLHDVQPVAKATGSALGGLLGQVDKEFQSGTWQQFFRFMAATAGPDIHIVSDAFTTLLDTLPPLLQDLQPLGRAILVAGDDAAHATRGIVGFYNAFQRNVPISNQHTINFLRDLDRWTVDLTNHLPGGRAINQWLTGAQHALSGAGAAAGPAARGIGSVAVNAGVAVTPLQAMATATRNLMTAQQNALNAQNTYAGTLVTSANDAHALEKALDASRGKVGLLTAIQRNSFAAANTYIADLGNQATAAFASGRGVDASIDAIRRGLPVLDSAKTKNRAYWAEVKTLVGWLDRLRNERAIRETVFVSGSGTFTVRPGTGLGLPGGSAGGPFHAAGGRVPPGFPNDTYAARLTSGEAVVPARLTPAVAPFLKAHGVPGFAGGGLIGSYHGPVAGLPPWGTHNLNATVGIFEGAIAKATLAGIRGAARAASGFGAAGPGGGAPAANAALARRMFPQWGSGPLWAAWNYVAMRESGWNQFARNPSSGAYGIPQALPPTKMPFAAQAAGGSNPAAQIGWMAAYMSQRYGGPAGAAQHEAAFGNYDRGGWLRPGLTLAYNATGRPEMVIPGRGGGTMKLQIEWAGGNAGDELMSWLRKQIRIRAGGDVQRGLGRR